jgi:hypothetical protein
MAVWCCQGCSAQSCSVVCRYRAHLIKVEFAAAYGCADGTRHHIPAQQHTLSEFTVGRSLKTQSWLSGYWLDGHWGNLSRSGEWAF